jgi:phosphoribosylformylglycinamidine synthase subunit II (EC 6.3.5.3)
VYEIDLLGADDADLAKISESRQLSLSLEEMKRIKKYFHKEGRNPTDTEIEAIAQAWSEHCSYKSSKPILKETVFRYKAPQGVLPISEDAGVVEFDDEHYYTVALESHNHPSALDPYGGAATGVGGIIRDILCMGSKPIALSNMLFFGPLNYPQVPEGIKHPDFLFRGVVKGISDYGNRVGIPTVSGLIYFDDSYVGNCLVNVGCVGIMKKEDLVRSRVDSSNDVFILAGGKTGRDGIHGVTFASFDLHAKSEETSRPAVQLGDPLTKEALIHACLECVEKKLLAGLKDFGGGGLSSVTCEMAHAGGYGAEIDLRKVPLRESSMEPWQIWVSESQERMMLAVKPENVEKILEIFDFWDIEARVIGNATSDKQLKVYYNSEKVCDLDMDFLLTISHKRGYEESPKTGEKEEGFPEPSDMNEALLGVISSPIIGSKEWAIRQYDHVIKGNTIVYPLQGKIETKGPGDAAVIRPVENSFKGLGIACDVNPRMVFMDPYWGTISAVEESFRNLISVGARPHSMADCLNFGDPEDKKEFGQFVSACKGLYFSASGFEVPFVSGNVSFYNKSHVGSILPTPTVMSIGMIEDVRKAVTMDVKSSGNLLYLIGETFIEFGGSEYLNRMYKIMGKRVPQVYPEKFKRKSDSLLKAMNKGLIKSCHDLSEGGLGVSLAEMLFAGGYGAEIGLKGIPGNARRFDHALFSESNGRWLVEVTPEDSKDFEFILEGVEFSKIGITTHEKILKIDDRVDLEIGKLYDAWKKPIFGE